jgi:uncharacterized protein (DUF488 family)
MIRSPDPARLWTIGHSTRTLEEFLALLALHEIQAITDVRRHPVSRRQPQFGREALEHALIAHGLAYLWIPELGGRRKARPDSPNTAWRNASFRGYADHIESKEFAQGLDALLELAAHLRTAVMCAELLWWRCHRALISDVLCVRGMEVTHILDEGHSVLHPYTSAAHVANGRLSYASRAHDA